MIRVTHFSDPGCPFAYSASPALAALRWRYGAQLEWRHVMIGLTEDAAQYAERGYTPLRMAQGQRRFRRFGMPLGRGPKKRLAATARACRTVVAVRLTQPQLEWPAFRALQLTQFTTDLPLDADEALLDALGRLPGVDPPAILARIDAPDVVEAYEADRAQARTAAGSPTEFQGKAANTDGAVRYTAPSLIFEHEDGRRLEAGGFQGLDAYDVCIANLDRSLDRRGAPDDLGELLAAFPDGLTAAEVAGCLAPFPEFADLDAAEDALLELVDAGRAVVRPVGDGTLWIDAGSPFAADLADRRARLGDPLRPMRTG
ncbi:MAG TPA: DsbA family protein [Solirubrobacteraceae bacterium]|nr:DsbA family protein [Solirubrobacteraceae bacterium]